MHPYLQDALDSIQRPLLTSHRFAPPASAYHLMFPQRALQMFVPTSIDCVNILNGYIPTEAIELRPHFRMLDRFWHRGFSHTPWEWMEQDLRLATAVGGDSLLASLEGYQSFVRVLAGRAFDQLCTLAVDAKIDGIVVHGLGHWLMAAASAAGRATGIPVLVSERGLLHGTLLVDVGVPFNHARSLFSEQSRYAASSTGGEEQGYSPEHWSRGDAYGRVINGSFPVSVDSDTLLVAGQCFADFGVLDAPFDSDESFLAFATSELKRMAPGHQFRRLLYRQHPLWSHGEDVELSHDGILVELDKRPPDAVARSTETLVCWNSTLGFERISKRGGPIVTLAPHVFYRQLLDSDQATVARFCQFVRSVSFPLH